MGRKLYVGNLSFQTTDHDLQELFSQVGACESATVIADRATGQSRGFGFVEMAVDTDVELAIQKFDGQDFMGRPLKVSEAREQTGGGGGGGRGGGGGGGGARRGWERRY